jgi:drug/metabolite transporter (DMT)-like permease
LTPHLRGLAGISATLIAMLAFAGNSILCRLALMSGSIDPAMFTAIRLLSGALALALILAATRRQPVGMARGSWHAGTMLFLYAVCFSYAYVSLGAATGALILFGFVQASMIFLALYRGDRPLGIEMIGWLFAAGGLLSLLLPGARSPSPAAALMMAVAGIAWGIYSILGKKEADALAATSANFLRSLVFVIPLVMFAIARNTLSVEGILLATASGALTSGVGYVIWYRALKHLTSLQAALVQLSVPAITAIGGAVLLAEALTLPVVMAGAAIVGGVLIALIGKARWSGQR